MYRTTNQDIRREAVLVLLKDQVMLLYVTTSDLKIYTLFTESTGYRAGVRKVATGRLKSEVSSWRRDIKIMIYGCDNQMRHKPLLLKAMLLEVGVNTPTLWSPARNLVTINKPTGKIGRQPKDRKWTKLAVSEEPRVFKIFKDL